MEMISKIGKKLTRIFLRYKWCVEYEKTLNQRSDIENYLINCSLGKATLPNKKKCAEMAKKLGVPSEWKN